MIFHGMHTLESIVAFLGASLFIKAVEKCSNKYCSDTVINTVIHETEHDLQDALAEDYEDSRSDHIIFNEPVKTQLVHANIKETL